MTSYNYDYISLLEYDTEQEIYDLTITTFSGKVDYLKVGFFFTEKRHEGRMHLVSYDLYGKPEYVGGLCMLNNMLNPFSVLSDTIYIYLPESDMQNLVNVPNAVKYGSEALSSVKSQLVDSLKRNKPNTAKNSFNASRGKDLLPPTVLDNNAPVVQMNNNKIQFAPNLFASPTPEQGSSDLTEEQQFPVSNTAQANYRRILVNRYIKTSD